jgi:transcriptional regulator with XRE-family HTH domain
MKRVVKTPFPAEPFVANAKVLGAAIRAGRTSQGLTIDEAAMMIGIAKQTLSDIELGKPTVGVGIVLNAALELGVGVFVTPAKERHLVEHFLRGEST